MHAPADSLGNTPLHLAIVGPQPSKDLARQLFAAGADPRAANREGATPIGLACLTWGLESARELFGAAAKDILDSTHLSWSASHPLPLPLHCLRRFDLGNWQRPGHEADPTAEFIELLAAASEDPRSSHPAFIDEAVDLCCSHGWAECLRAVLAHGLACGVRPQAKSFAHCLRLPAMGPTRDEARFECWAIALESGIDPREEFKDGTGRPGSLTWHAIDSYIDCSSKRNFGGPQGRALLEAELRRLALSGCDPAEARARGWNGGSVPIQTTRAAEEFLAELTATHDREALARATAEKASTSSPSLRV